MKARCRRFPTRIFGTPGACCRAGRRGHGSLCQLPLWRCGRLPPELPAAQNLRLWPHLEAGPLQRDPVKRWSLRWALTRWLVSLQDGEGTRDTQGRRPQRRHGATRHQGARQLAEAARDGPGPAPARRGAASVPGGWPAQRQDRFCCFTPRLGDFYGSRQQLVPGLWSRPLQVPTGSWAGRGASK